MSFNAFTGSNPDLSGVPNLLSFTASNNKLSGSITFNFNNTKKLKILLLNDNAFTGSVPDLSGCTELEYLSLAHNRLTHIGTALLLNTKLISLELQNNRIGESLPHLSYMQNLKTVDLSSNLIKGSLTNFVFAPNIMTLKLQNNLLSGILTFGADYPTLEFLTHLDMSNNPLNVSLPSLWGYFCEYDPTYRQGRISPVFYNLNVFKCSSCALVGNIVDVLDIFIVMASIVELGTHDVMRARSHPHA